MSKGSWRRQRDNRYCTAEEFRQRFDKIDWGKKKARTAGTVRGAFALITETPNASKSLEVP